MTFDHPEASFNALYRRRHGRSLRQIGGSEKLAFTWDGRSAIYSLFSSMRDPNRDVVLVPAFHCVAAIEPIIAAGFDVRFYGVDVDLSIKFDDINSIERSRVRAALAIEFFGFPQNIERLREVLDDPEISIVADCSHSFFDPSDGALAGSAADFAIYSFWKLLPSGAGGGSVALGGGDSAPARVEVTAPLSATLRTVKTLFEDALVRSNLRLVNAAYAQLEKIRIWCSGARKKQPQPDKRMNIPASYLFDESRARWRLPRIVKAIIMSADLDRMAVARRKNYLLVLESLTGNLLDGVVRPVLADNVCPWAFPLLLPARGRLEQALRADGFRFFTFGETLHPAMQPGINCSQGAYEVAHRLAGELFCLAIDQCVPDQSLEKAKHLGGIVESLSQSDAASTTAGEP